MQETTQKWESLAPKKIRQPLVTPNNSLVQTRYIQQANRGLIAASLQRFQSQCRNNGVTWQKNPEEHETQLE